MSYGIEIYCAVALTSDQLADVIADIDGLRADVTHAGPGAHHEIERAVRGRYDHVAVLDGPLRVETEDLPEAVRASAVGVAWTYQLNCPWSPAARIRITNRLARSIAKAARGVVFDSQEDSVTWPRGGTRKFVPSKERLIDLVELEWYVRREDRPKDLPGLVFDTIQTLLPEALPRRFGGHEPLQFKLDEEGRSGFVREWQAEDMMLFWKTKRPCLSGIMFGLGAACERPKRPSHPVGSIGLSFHGEAFSDGRWRLDVAKLFLAMIERTHAFAALADVVRSVGYSGGNLWYGPEAESTPGLVVRDQWLGLPPHAFWLAWLGPRYRELVADALPERAHVESIHGGLFVRSGEEPPAAADMPAMFPAFPSRLTMRFADPDEFGLRDRKRATRVPRGL